MVATEKKDADEKNKNSNLVLNSFEKEISEEELRQKGVGVSEDGKNLNEIQAPAEHSVEQKPTDEVPEEKEAILGQENHERVAGDGANPHPEEPKSSGVGTLESEDLRTEEEGENDAREDSSESSDGEDSKESRVDLEKLNELQSKSSISEEALGAILAKFI